MTTPSSPDPLPLRWAVILLAASLVALLVGALTSAQTGSPPAAVLAALTAFGVAVPGLHGVVGR
jgi:hypothetical protein